MAKTKPTRKPPEKAGQFGRPAVQRKDTRDPRATRAGSHTKTEAARRR